MIRRAARPVLAAVLAVAALVTLPSPAGAHAFLVASAPGRKATVTEAPARVVLTFNERLEGAYSTVSVWDAAGRQVDARNPALAPDDARRLVVTLPRLGPGTYTVRFRVLSVDGHVVESSFPFTVAPAPRR